MSRDALLKLREFIAAAKAPGNLPWALVECDVANWLIEHEAELEAALASPPAAVAVTDARLRELLAAAIAGLEGGLAAAGGKPGPNTAKVIAESKAALTTSSAQSAGGLDG